MRPIRGFIIRKSPFGPLVDVKLENGRIVAAEDREGLSLYDKVDVFFNLIKKEVVKVQKAVDCLEARCCKAEELPKDDVPWHEEPEDVPPPDIDYEEVEGSGSGGSGALAPDSDGSVWEDSGFWVLEP